MVLIASMLTNVKTMETFFMLKVSIVSCEVLLPHGSEVRTDAQAGR
jgi:hypothetical protein